MKTPARFLPILLVSALGGAQIPDATAQAVAAPVAARAEKDSVPVASTDAAKSPTDSVRPALGEAVPSVGDTVVGRRNPQVPLVVRSSAPVGSRVTFDGIEASVDSTGKFRAAIGTDSLRRFQGSYDLCLLVSGQSLCTPIRPQGFDTLDIAPLQIKIDSVVETHDTVRTIVDTTRFDSSALAAASGPKLIQSAASKTVTIRGKRRPPRVLGQERVTVQTIKRMPALAEPDVMRAVQVLPGVVSSSDYSTKIYVRGSSSDQNLILFDNAVVYNPAHFGGIFSAFLADAIGGLDFYKGGFDPRYGDRLASVLLVSSKVGGTDRDSARDSTSLYRKYLDKGLRNAEALVSKTPTDSEPKAKSQGAMRITTFSGSIETDGQQGDASWALAGRRTWIGAALSAARALNLTDLALDYDFYDWQGSAAWGHDGDTVRASIYQGRDKLSIDPISLEWGNLVVPVNVRWKLSDRLTFQGTGSYSKFDQDLVVDPVYDFHNDVETWGARGELRYDAGAGHLVSLGSEYNTFHVNFTEKSSGSTFKSVSNTDLWAGWLQDRWVINPQHTVSAGVRGYWYGELGEASADPRISYTWRPNSDWKLDAHWGHYTQYLTSIRFADMEMPTEFWFADLKPMKSTTQDMTSLGVERNGLTPFNLHANVDGYYKDIHNMPLYYPNASSTENAAADAAGYDQIASKFSWLDGYALGAELSVGKDDGWWTGNVSYAYSQAVLRQQDYGTTTYDPYWADWDQRHTFKLSAGINWIGRKDGEALSVHKMGWGDYYRTSLQLTASSGQPYTEYLGYDHTTEPFQGEVGSNSSIYPDNGIAYVKGTRNGARKPMYFRLDVTPIDWGRAGHWRFYFTIINITDHDNVYSLSYSTENNTVKKRTVYQLPRLPIFLGYEYQF